MGRRNSWSVIVSNAPPYRAAVIGCGYIGSRIEERRPGSIASHAGACKAAAGTELVGLYDADPARARAAADHWGVAAFPSLEALLDEARPEIVSVATPTRFHAAQIDACLRHDSVLAVLAEKPLALSATDARRLEELSRSLAKPLAVNYSRRFDPGHQKVADAIHGGKLGRIQHVSGWYTKGIRHNGSHMLDLLGWYFGAVKSAAVTAVHPWASGDNEADDDPGIDADIEYTGGARARIFGCDAAAHNIFELFILGEAGRIRLSESGHRIELQLVGDDPHNPGYRALGEAEVLQTVLKDPALHAVEDLVAVLSGDKDAPASNAASACTALELAERLATDALALALRPGPSSREGGP